MPRSLTCCFCVLCSLPLFNLVQCWTLQSTQNVCTHMECHNHSCKHPPLKPAEVQWLEIIRKPCEDCVTIAMHVSSNCERTWEGLTRSLVCLGCTRHYNHSNPSACNRKAQTEDVYSSEELTTIIAVCVCQYMASCVKLYVGMLRQPHEWSPCNLAPCLCLWQSRVVQMLISQLQQIWTKISLPLHSQVVQTADDIRVTFAILLCMCRAVQAMQTIQDQKLDLTQQQWTAQVVWTTYVTAGADSAQQASAFWWPPRDCSKAWIKSKNRSDVWHTCCTGQVLSVGWEGLQQQALALTARD